MPLRLSKNRVLLDGIPLNESKSSNLASAATIDIWSVTGNVVPITGTATISAFSAAPQAGTKRTLLCTGTPTFTHGANFLLPGSADYTATAGDRIEVLAVTTTQFRLSILTSLFVPSAGLGKIARMKTNAIGTSIAPSTGVGTYNTKWVMNEVEQDDIGGVADLASSQFVIPSGYTKVIISYNCSWAYNTVQPSASDTTLAPIVNMGYRAGRIKNGLGINYGNQRISPVIGATTTNVLVTTGVISVTPGWTFAIYPAQTSNETLLAGVDLASSWMQIELFP